MKSERGNITQEGTELIELTNSNSRPSWDEYFSTIAVLTSKRSNCVRRHVGCIIVKNKRILSLGYNGTPRGTANCFEGGCIRCNSPDSTAGSHLDLCMCLHAEENAMLFVSQRDLEGADMYITLMPCISCTKKIIQCGISRVVYKQSYAPELDTVTLHILQRSGVRVEKIE